MTGLDKTAAPATPRAQPPPADGYQENSSPGGRSGQENLQATLRESGLRRLGAGTACLSPAQKAKWWGSVKAATEQMRAAQRSVDRHSTFSALNLDCVKTARAANLSRLRLESGGSTVPKTLAGIERTASKQSGSSEAAASRDGAEERGDGSGACEAVKPGLGPAAAGPDSDVETSYGNSFVDRSPDTSGEADLSLPAFGRCASFGLSSVASGCGDEAPYGIAEYASPAAEPQSSGPVHTCRFILSYRPEPGPMPAELLGLGVQIAAPAAGSRRSESSVPEERPAPVSLADALWTPAARPCMPSRQVSAPAACSAGSPFARQCSAPAVGPTQGVALPTPSPRAFRAGAGSRSPMEELRRSVKCLLNKVCPESVASIASKFSEVAVRSSEELQEVILMIFQKALSEPHYCATYADLIFNLRSAFPEFPAENGGRRRTFRTLLLDVCQREFEVLPAELESAGGELSPCDSEEETELRRKRTKDRLLANMKLIGHLFLRQMLSARIIGAVIQELTLCCAGLEDRLPEGHCVECAVELLLSVGHALEALPAGQQAIAQVCARLLELKQRRDANGRSAYCKRIQFAIQDLLDVRAAGWAKKVFGGVARTKEEIRMEQERDCRARASGKEVDGGQVIISGQRPSYIEATLTGA